jgi:hypothetical protein
MAKEERVFKMKLAEFDRYLDDKSSELAACYKQLDEVRALMDAAYKAALSAWQESMGYCYPRLAQQRAQMPPAFAQVIDRTEAEERARLQKEIADLEREISEGRAKADDLLAQAQAVTVTLSKANPQLNKTEEALKARMVRLQDKYAQAYEEIEKLDHFPLGWLANASKIGKLKKTQRSLKGEQAKVLRELRQVRQEWADDLQKTGDTQADLHQAWEQASIKASESQTRHDHLQENLEDLATQAGFQRVLEELDQDYDVPGELGAGLKQLVERNRVRHTYEGAMSVVSEALGRTKGVGEGLKRFQQSLGQVIREQRQYNLKDVKLPLPESSVMFNETWKALAADIKDEKGMAARPLDFSRIASTYIKERLSDEQIKDLFETMGAGLTKATAEWK